MVPFGLILIKRLAPTPQTKPNVTIGTRAYAGVVCITYTSHALPWKGPTCQGRQGSLLCHALILENTHTVNKQTSKLPKNTNIYTQTDPKCVFIWTIIFVL